VVLGVSCSGTLADYTTLATASDNCSSVTVTQSPAAGTVVSGVGVTSITLTATDASGNTSTCSFNVNRVDQTAPSFTFCPSPVTSASPNAAGCVYTTTVADATAADNCSVSSLTWIITGPGAVAPFSGAAPMGPHSFGLGLSTITYTATDASGNTSTCFVTVSVANTLAGSITGTTTVVQGAGTSPITFSGSGGVKPYTFTYKINGGTNLTAATTGSNSSVTVAQSNAVTGQFIYKLISIADANGCTGTIPVNDADTINIVNGRPDLFSAIERPLNSQFINGQFKEGYITVANAAPYPTTGTVTFRVSFASNFNLEILATTTASAGTTVNNTDWNITAGQFYYTITSKPGIVINGSNASIKIGYKLTATGFSNSNGIMTVTILNGTGGSDSTNGDSNNLNNQSVKLFSVN
jgi:hypothetical protein